MDNLLAARWQMGLSLGFHIIFAVIGMTMPFFMAAAHWRWLRTGRRVWLDLTITWSKGVAIFFAVGAVSGTVLSFELGLLWPGFMEKAGPVIGMPFSWEGAAFFTEAVFLGLYLYGRGRLSDRLHFLTGLGVGFSGLLSGIFVTCVNAWMNAPAGFDIVDGQFVNIRPFEAMFNPAWQSQVTHMVIASFEAAGFAVAGLHAFLLLKHPDNELHKAAFKVACAFAVSAALLQPLSGHSSAQDVAERQPLKLAAMEALYETTTEAPLLIGGWPSYDEQSGQADITAGLEIPGMLSFLAFNDTAAEVKGLKEFNREHWPNVPLVHAAYQVMIGIGSLLMAVSVAWLYLFIRRRPLLFHPRVLKAAALLTPLGFIALEAGWTVTEAGRQPWIIYNLMTVKESLTEVPYLQIHFFLFTAIYAVLAFWVVVLMKRHIDRTLDYRPGEPHE